MKMNETDIKNIIAESIKTYVAEQHIKNTIKQLVRESLENMGGFSQFESSDEEDGRLSDMNTETDNEAETRDSIEKFFKQPGVNNAPYAYKLYNVDAKEGQDTTPSFPYSSAYSWAYSGSSVIQIIPKLSVAF